MSDLTVALVDFAPALIALGCIFAAFFAAENYLTRDQDDDAQDAHSSDAL